MTDLHDDRTDAIQEEEEQETEGRLAKITNQLSTMVESVVDSGIGPLSGAVAWAEDRLRRVQRDRFVLGDGTTRKVVPEDHDDIEKVIGRLIRESVEAAGAAGFVTGLGGFIAMPITLPANLAGAMIINARLAAAIAYLRGYDPKDPHVRTGVLLVAMGSNAQEVVKAFGIKVGEKLAMKAIQKIPMKVIYQINKKVGITLLAKYGTKRSVVTLAKGVPLIGGAIGGAVDATMTALVGKTASSLFVFD